MYSPYAPYELFFRRFFYFIWISPPFLLSPFGFHNRTNPPPAGPISIVGNWLGIDPIGSGMAPVPVPVLWQRARGLYRGNCYFSFSFSFLFYFILFAEGRAPTELFLSSLSLFLNQQISSFRVLPLTF